MEVNMRRVVFRSAIIGLVLAMAGLFGVHAVSAGEAVKTPPPPATITGAGSAPVSKQPAVQAVGEQKKATGMKGVPQLGTSDVKVLSIDTLNVVPPQAGSVLLQWTCRVKNNSPLPFEAQSVYVGGYQKTGEGNWIAAGQDVDIGKIGPSATRDYVKQFSTSNNSTRFKIKIMQAGNIIKESQEIVLPAVPLPQVIKKPEVVSIEILPPLADCKARWKVTVKNPNDVPFDKPVTISVVQRHNTVAYKPGDGVIAANSIQAGQTVTATGEFMGDMGNQLFLKNYTIEVKVDGKGQNIADQFGNIPAFNQNITISDCRLDPNHCYVTLSNGNSYQACTLFMGSQYGQSSAPDTWTDGIGFGVDIPPNGSVERTFQKQSGFDRIKIKVIKGSQTITEKTMPLQ
jgi:hypothetical protein